MGKGKDSRGRGGQGQWKEMGRDGEEGMDGRRQCREGVKTERVVLYIFNTLL